MALNNGKRLVPTPTIGYSKLITLKQASSAPNSDSNADSFLFSKAERDQLLRWYQENKRPLPWRKKSHPYATWVSEIMLQQTTVTAVIPYFTRFMKRFPQVKDLADASIEEIYEYWAGLGYYSRARSLHKAAQQIHALGHFPKTWEELIQLPGFGDYSARSVASLAFGQSVGVVDGNVIRVFSRRWGHPWQWWKTKEKKELQNLSDQLNSWGQSREVNQGLMELGATICRPKNPSCLLCPWLKSCQTQLMKKTPEDFPLRKPKKATEIWRWSPQIIAKGSKLALVKNDYAPFLKNQWILPGTVARLNEKPMKYAFQHGITNHKIFVSSPRRKSELATRFHDHVLWVTPQEISKKAPFNLVKKVMDLKP